MGYIHITGFNSQFSFFCSNLSGMMVHMYVFKRHVSISGAMHAQTEPKWEAHVYKNNNNVICLTVK